VSPWLKSAIIPVVIATFFLFFFIILFGLPYPTAIDYVYCVVLVAVLRVFSKKNVIFAANSALLLLVFYVFGSMKLQYFGEPASPADIVSLVALYSLQSEQLKWFALLLTFLSGVLLFFNLEYTRRLFTFLVGLMIALFSSVLFGASIDASSIYMKELMQSESVSLRQYYATVRFYDEWLRQPGTAEVAKAQSVAGLSLVNGISLDGALKRDVYLIVIESLWDPSVLGDTYAKDPLDENFKTLWMGSGHRYILGPAFGGGTANPEFEILCGVSLNSGFIAFGHPLLHENLQCLPNVLRSVGYHTVASHPNNRDFWNRDFAYPAIGFDRYYSIADFVKDDVIGNNYLSDSSLYRQYTEISHKETRPELHYILTAAEHYPYMTGAGTISVQDDDSEPMRLLESYVGLVKRGTRDVYNYIEAIRTADKNALIVVLGDHPPLFGRNFVIYRDAGLISNQKSSMSVSELLHLYSTPIVIVDGVNGAVKPTIQAMYELPSMIMDMLACYGKACDRTNDGSMVHYRPVSGRGVLYYAEQQWRLCESSDVSPNCATHLDWLAAARVVRNNLILGGSYVK
jgi:hypothetical protein